MPDTVRVSALQSLGAGRPGGAVDRPSDAWLRRLAAVVAVLFGSVFTAGVYAQEIPAVAEETVASPVEDTVVTPADDGDFKPGEEGTRTERPWAFSLGAYMWLAGVRAEISSGHYDASIDESLVDIFDATDGIPLTIGGRAEGWWNRVGLHVDGNYFYLNFKDQDVNGVNTGVVTRMGLLEYAAMFRVSGQTLAQDLSHWAEKSGPPQVDLYAGGRTLWMENEIAPDGLQSESNQSTVTSPLVGGRLAVGLSPRWLFVLDGNAGGFGVNDVDFTGEGLAAIDYRTRLFGAPIELSLGYKVLYLNVEVETRTGGLASETLMHGPAFELMFSF